jgi:tellurite resistance protein TehA-like permease
VEPSPLLPYIYALIIAAAVCFLSGVVARFIRHKEGTLWWRGAIGILLFAMALTLLEILSALATRPR